MNGLTTAAFAGCAVGGICLCLARCCPTPVAVERSWFDRPPFAFRLLWPMIRLLSYRGLAGRRLAFVEGRIATAGLDYRLCAVEQIALQRACAILMASMVTVGLDGSPGGGIVALVMSSTAAAWLAPQAWLNGLADRRRREIIATLPQALELVTLAVEAGQNLAGGLIHAQRRLPAGALQDELARVLRDTRAGRTRADALRGFAVRVDDRRLRQIVSALLQAERSGGSVIEILRVHAESLRQARFQEAERRALEAPVKLLLPLVLFVFPTTFVVFAFLMLSKAISSGLVEHPFLVWASRWPGA